jgi:hypothetical protein
MGGTVRGKRRELSCALEAQEMQQRNALADSWPGWGASRFHFAVLA